MAAGALRRVGAVVVDENADALTVVVAVDREGSGEWLMVQCAAGPPTPQDVATGMDTYCVMDDAGAVQYGGIERVELRGRQLVFRFGDDAVDELALDGPELALDLDVPAADLAAFAAGLRRVLAYGDPRQWPELLGLDA